MVGPKPDCVRLALQLQLVGRLPSGGPLGNQRQRLLAACLACILLLMAVD